MMDNQFSLSNYQKAIIYAAIFGLSFISIVLLFIMLGFIVPKLLIVIAFTVGVFFTSIHLLALYAISMFEEINAKKDK